MSTELSDEQNKLLPYLGHKSRAEEEMSQSYIPQD